MIKHVASNLGIFLVFGLLAGMLFHNSALGVLGGLVCHLLVNSVYNANTAKPKEIR